MRGSANSFRLTASLLVLTILCEACKLKMSGDQEGTADSNVAALSSDKAVWKTGDATPAKLSWSDFTETDALHGSDAWIGCTIALDDLAVEPLKGSQPSKVVVKDVTAKAYITSLKLKKDSMPTAKLLAHEQGHWDLCRQHAVVLKGNAEKVVVEKQFKDKEEARNALTKTVATVVEDLDSAQSNYDLNTDHGLK